MTNITTDYVAAKIAALERVKALSTELYSLICILGIEEQDCDELPEIAGSRAKALRDEYGAPF